MPPLPAGRPGAGGGRSGCDCLGSGHDRSPHPGPSGLDLGSRPSPVPKPSRPDYGGCSSPSPSGAGDDDRSSTIGMTPFGLFFASIGSSIVWRN